MDKLDSVALLALLDSVVLLGRREHTSQQSIPSHSPADHRGPKRWVAFAQPQLQNGGFARSFQTRPDLSVQREQSRSSPHHSRLEWHTPIQLR